MIGNHIPQLCERTSLVSQMVKNLPAMQETQVLSLGLEDPLEKGMAIHSSILAWGISWTEEPGGLQESDMTEELTLSLSCLFEKVHNKRKKGL